MNASSSEIFMIATALALALSVILRVWLSLRQSRFVRARRQQVPAAFAGRVSLAAHQKAADYTLAKTRLGLAALAVETFFFLALAWGGGLQALHEFWAERLQGLPYGVALIASVAVLSGLIELPLNLYRQFRLEARFGFNRMTPSLFFSDLLKQTLVSALLGIPLLTAILWLMAVMGEAWWFYAWLLWMAFNLFALLVYPLWIAPRFNRFTPLPEGEIKARVDALLQRGQFGARELYVMDGSRRSSHGNAYFTGFGKARRIVFFDTLLERLSPAQIEAVLAHELGHFHHRHIAWRMALVFVLSLLFLALLGQLLDAAWFFQGLGLSQGNTALALTLFALVVPLFAFPLAPLMNALSRRHEFEADAYAARLASAGDLEAALVKLHEDNAATLTPDPLYSRFHDSHPSASLRVARLRAAAQS
jgi:STE24 endopeptidase